MEVRVCPGCDRDFLPSTCEFHCGPVCCRKMKCQYAKPHRESQRKSMQAQRRCVVCGAHGDWFERFAPCSENCRKAWITTAYQGRQWKCWEHHPIEKERIHVKYCKLEHYNSWTYGHYEKLRRRWRRHGRATGKSRYNYRRALQEAGGKLY